MDQTLRSEHLSSAAPQVQLRAGIEDVVIVPLVVTAFAVAKVLHGSFTVLINLIDWLFPILLQVMRFPLFTLRILGDGIAALFKGIVQILPVGGARRLAWREFIGRQWARLRAKISYKAFEEWLHHVVEDGMAWVFRKCRSLTPRGALLVLVGAVLWLPVSFGAATLMHAVLFAKALVWPAWLQLLHPLATVIAKSKLLVLPVYPAAWPQAKQHPLIKAMIGFFRYVATLNLARKTGVRYRQTQHLWNRAAGAADRASAALGLTALWHGSVSALNAAAFAIGRGTRATFLLLVGRLAAIPLFGGIVRRYQQHYEDACRHPKLPVSERIGDFYARWSVKFTAKYYEDRERAQVSRDNLDENGGGNQSLKRRPVAKL
jgi:hypothetical protein